MCFKGCDRVKAKRLSSVVVGCEGHFEGKCVAYTFVKAAFGEFEGGTQASYLN